MSDWYDPNELAEHIQDIPSDKGALLKWLMERRDLNYVQPELLAEYGARDYQRAIEDPVHSSIPESPSDKCLLQSLEGVLQYLETGEGPREHYDHQDAAVELEAVARAAFDMMDSDARYAEMVNSLRNLNASIFWNNEGQDEVIKHVRAATSALERQPEAGNGIATRTERREFSGLGLLTN